MFKSKKIAAVAGVLGGFVLIGAGAAQAVGAENPGDCVKDDRGTVRCEQVTEYEVKSKDHGKIRFVNDTRQTCSGGPEVSCTSSVTLPGKRS